MTADDDLDRALAALPLEEPPHDLRSRILASTIYRTAPVFSSLELWLIAGTCALAVWLVSIALGDTAALGGHLTAVAALLDTRLTMLLTPTTLEWTATGGAISLWLLFLQNGTGRNAVRP